MNDTQTIKEDNKEIECEHSLKSITDFQKKTHPRFIRNDHGELVPAVPNSTEAGYERDPDNGYLLTKL